PYVGERRSSSACPPLQRPTIESSGTLTGSGTAPDRNSETCSTASPTDCSHSSTTQHQNKGCTASRFPHSMEKVIRPFIEGPRRNVPQPTLVASKYALGESASTISVTRDRKSVV